MIDLHFTLTQAEYLEAQKLYLKKSRLRIWVRWFFVIILLVGIATVAFTTKQSFSGDAFSTLLPGLVLLLFFLCLPLVQTWAFKKRFLKEKQNLTNCHLVIDDAGYHLDVPGIGGGVAEWGGMDGWLEGKSVFVLRSGLLMRLFPKEPLTEAQLHEVQTLLTDKLGPVGIMRKR